jgi:hypothetical protein
MSGCRKMNIAGGKIPTPKEVPIFPRAVVSTGTNSILLALIFNKFLVR